MNSITITVNQNAADCDCGDASCDVDQTWPNDQFRASATGNGNNEVQWFDTKEEALQWVWSKLDDYDAQGIAATGLVA